MQSRPGVSPLEWRLAEMLALHPGLALMPSRSADVVIEGDLYFRRAGPGGVVIADTYTLSIEVPRTFPRALPRVVETRGKVPRISTATRTIHCASAPRSPRDSRLSSTRRLARSSIE